VYTKNNEKYLLVGSIHMIILTFLTGKIAEYKIPPFKKWIKK